MPRSAVMNNLAAQPLPWQHEQWQRIQQQRAQQHLPHSLLFAGPVGVGKRNFARALSRLLLCQTPADALACGQCRSCLLLAAGTHPDWQWIAPEERGKAIKIDQVRAVVEFMTHTSQQGGRKIAVVEPAESMNRNAANALLKTLEEPSGNALLILVADAPGRLLPTIRSRCQRLDFPAPPAAQSRAWLSLRGIDAAKIDTALLEADSKPLLASELLDGDGIEQRRQLSADLNALLERKLSLVALAERWQQIDWLMLLQWLQNRMALAIKSGMTGAMNSDALMAHLIGVPAAILFRLHDQIQAALNQTLAGTNPNRQLALEALLIATCDAVSKKIP